MPDHTATASGDCQPILTERSRRVSFQILEKENKNQGDKIDSKDEHPKFDRRRFQKLSKIRNRHYNNNSQLVATSKVSSIPEPTKENKNTNAIESNQSQANRIDMNVKTKYRSLASQSRKIQQEMHTLQLQKSRKRRSHQTFNILQEEEQKAQSPIIVASKPFRNSKSLGKANLNARRALKDLANKYNQPSPTNVTSLKLSEPSVTSTSVSTHESECGSTSIETNNDRVDASIEIDCSSKCDESIAMMTACLDSNSYEATKTSLIDKVIRVSNGECMATENETEVKTGNGVEDNPDILAQLTSIIGSSAQITPDSRERHVTNSSEEKSVQSYHFPYMHYETYENDASSVLSPLTCERNFETVYEKRNNGKSSAFRWCLLIWMFSLFLVYERCLSNEIYLISQRRRQVEAFMINIISCTGYHLNSAIHQFGDVVEYVKSSHMLAMELMNDIIIEIKSDDKENSLQDSTETEEHRHVDYMVNDSDNLFQLDKTEVESVESQECSATNPYFYYDMSECTVAENIGDVNLVDAFSSRFYQDMTICFKEENGNILAFPMIQEDAYGQSESSAMESMFYRAMTEFQIEKTSSENAFHFKPYSFSNRFTRRSYVPSPLTKMVVLYPTEESDKDNCFFNDVGANPRIDHPSDLFCQYLVPTPSGRRRLKKRRTTNETYPRNTAFDYMTSEVDNINDVPVIEIVMEFIRRILPSGKRKNQS